MTEPHWKGRGIAAAAVGRKSVEASKQPRDYFTDALAAFGTAWSLSTTQQENRPILAAIIVAQALDRLGERIIEAAAITRRT